MAKTAAIWLRGLRVFMLDSSWFVTAWPLRKDALPFAQSQRIRAIFPTARGRRDYYHLARNPETAEKSSLTASSKRPRVRCIAMYHASQNCGDLPDRHTFLLPR